MTGHPAPTRKDHQKFCETEGWVRIRNARGKAGTYHRTYEFALPDARILRTRISHPPDRSTYGKAMWGHISGDQLEVSEEVFWACVRDGKKPERGQRMRPQSALPASLVHQLVMTFHVPEDEVASMTKQEAIDRLTALWSRAD